MLLETNAAMLSAEHVGSVYNLAWYKQDIMVRWIRYTHLSGKLSMTHHHAIQSVSQQE